MANRNAVDRVHAVLMLSIDIDTRTNFGHPTGAYGDASRDNASSVNALQYNASSGHT